MKWRSAKPEKIKEVEVRLYVEECEDILRAVEYLMCNFDVSTLDKKPGDMYSIWYLSIRNSFIDMLDEIRKINERGEWWWILVLTI